MTRALERSLIPGAGTYHSSPQKKFEELVIFVPFFGGQPEHLKKHVQLMLSLGYDCVTFHLSYHKKWILAKIPKSRSGLWGLKHLWADEIEDVLNAFSNKPKIIFSFSNPTSAAIEAISRRPHPDVMALICDGGPFVRLAQCNWNYFTHEKSIKSKSARLSLTLITVATWSANHVKTLKEAFSLLPNGFPILSIRAWQDELVPTKAIEQAFAPHLKKIKLEVLHLPESGHLQGLKDEPEKYKERVALFLKEVHLTRLQNHKQIE